MSVPTQTLGVGTDVHGHQVPFLLAALDLFDAVGGVRSVRVLGQLAGREEAVREEGDLLADGVVGQPGPGLEDVLGHPAHHEEGAGPDDLDVDVALVHVLHVRGEHVLLVVLVPQGPGALVVRAHENALRLRRVGRHQAGGGSAVSVWRRHVTVNVVDFLALVHV